MKLYNRETGQLEEIPDSVAHVAISRGSHVQPDQGMVNVVAPSGVAGSMPVEEAQAYQAKGLVRIEDPAQSQYRRDKNEFGDSPVTTFLEQGLDAATIGIFPAITDAIGLTSEENRDKRAQFNPRAATAGQVAGVVAPALLSGGAGALGGAARLTPVGAIARAGTGITERVLAGGASTFGRRMGAQILGGAVEGALYSGSEQVVRALTSDEAVSAEAFVSGLGKGILYGGLGGTAGGLLGEASQATSKAFRDYSSRLDHGADALDLAEEISSINAQTRGRSGVRKALAKEARQVDEAIQTEATALAKQQDEALAGYRRAVDEQIPAFKEQLAYANEAAYQVSGRAQLVEDYYKMGMLDKAAYSEFKAAKNELIDAVQDARKYFPSKTSPRPNQAGELTLPKGTNHADVFGDRIGDAKHFYDHLLLSDDALIKTVGKPEARAALKRQIEASKRLEDLVSDTDGVISRFRPDMAADDLVHAASKEIPQGPITSDKLRGLVQRQAELSEILAMTGDDVQTTVARKIVATAERHGYQATAEELLSEAKKMELPVSKIEPGSDMETMLKSRLYTSRAQEAAGIKPGWKQSLKEDGSLKSIAAYMVLDQITSQAEGALRAIPFIGAALPYLRTLTRYKGQFRAIASKTLSGLATGVEHFGTGAKKVLPLTSASRVMAETKYGETESRPGRKPSGYKAPTAFESRQAEIQSAMADMEQFRRKLAGKVSGIEAVDPKLAAQLVDHEMRKIEFLASKLPPAPIDTPFGPKGKATQADQDRFARYMAAVEDPSRLIAELQAGRLVPETVEATKVVYPAIYNWIKTSLLEKADELRGKLSYGQQVNLSILFETPITPSMDGQSIAFYQSNLQPPEQPKGSGFGGTSKAPQPTRAQEMAG